MIIGQEKICNKIDNLKLDAFPRSLMLVGAAGSGKHLLAEYIATKFKLKQMDITEVLSVETIEQCNSRVVPYLYLIRINDIGVRKENIILKFLEEPLKNSFILLLAETNNGILKTILNRCQIWYLQNYNIEYLKRFISTDNPYILDIAETPGQVLELNNSNLSDMVALADKILDYIHVANISNTLTLSKQLKFKSDETGFDEKLFVKVMSRRVHDRWVSTADVRYANAYKLTNEWKKYIIIKTIDHRCVFEKYLLDLRRVMRGEA